MMRLSAWLLQLAYRFRRYALDRELARHVLVCTGRKAKLFKYADGDFRYMGACTKDLVNCDEGEFCKIGKLLFNESFDLTFKINEEVKHALG